MNEYKVGDADTRPWGNYRVVASDVGFCVKVISVNAGGILSLQRHQFRAEHWTVVRGRAVVTLDGESIQVVRDQGVYIPTGAWHRIENQGGQELVFIEVQTGDKLLESDIERKEDKYNRK
jgi:mannose-6-phosphate isomerase-like protein (cupin superfamily)